MCSMAPSLPLHVELSATTPVLCLPAWHPAPCHDDNEPSSEILSPHLNALLYKSFCVIVSLRSHRTVIKTGHEGVFVVATPGNLGTKARVTFHARLYDQKVFQR